jgi:hypothetical protein
LENAELGLWLKPVFPAMEEAKVGGLWLGALLGKNVRLYLKNTKVKRAGGEAEEVDRLPSKHTGGPESKP